MLQKQERRLQVSIDEIRSHDRELADGLLNLPFEFLPCLDSALKGVAQTVNDKRMEINDDTMMYVALTGSFGECAVNPRTLGSKHLNHLVSLEGIVSGFFPMGSFEDMMGTRMVLIHVRWYRSRRFRWSVQRS